MLTAIRPRRLLVVLAVVSVLLGAVSLVLNLTVLHAADTPAQLAAGLRSGALDLLSVNREANLPTWFSSALLLAAGAAAAATGVWAHRTRDRWRWHWSILAVAFCYLAVDELLRLHEKANHQVAEVVDPSGVFTFGWWLLAAPLVALFAAAYIRFLRALPAPIGLLIVVGGTLYVGGAIGMEMVGSWLADDRGTTVSAAYVLATTAEEVLEMLGVVVFLYAVTSYAHTRARVVDAPVAHPATPPAEAVDGGVRGRREDVAGAGTTAAAPDGPGPASEIGAGSTRAA
ncbi:MULTISPECIES: hypothetical protein [unclassified Modestobacter]|uniref:hypothetical protein n=1 Tax=unclassified Modestobacter TaxID=2643866 RepID=UPI0022AB2740|nr:MULTISPECIES: hypothetical protein [unclassified Modestobacter]MCZ2822935.1 hypothetical protein [Modestobacter sp. VKM Ac-2981]MCZ2851181.1 hypothetical protein [Modestobacter sp. VKM Ac-2982]